MSCLTKSQFQYVNNDNKKACINVGDADEDFNFQYDHIDQFKNIIKDVRKQRICDEKEKIWTSFFKKQEHLTSYSQKISDEFKHKSNRTLAESFKEVDRELKRLNDDTLTESYIHMHNSNTRNKQYKNPSIYAMSQDSPDTITSGTSSINLLLPIEEEKKAQHRTISSELCKPYKTYIKKSCSDQKFKKNKIHNTFHHFSTNDLDYGYSPEISSNQLSNESDSIFDNPDPLVVTKILGIQKKISIVLDLISNELDRIPLPDGEKDFHRRQQRTAEFSTRLSRNYLYELSRRISDIERHIKTIDPVGKIKLSRRGTILHMQATNQKLISTHQLLLTALTAYWKHIPSSVLKNHPGKLKEILQILEELKNICIKLKLIPDCHCAGDDRGVFFGNETENQCTIILSKCRLNSDNESQIPSQTTRSTIITPSYIRKQRNRKTLCNRLSMYTMDMRFGKIYQPKKFRNRILIPQDRKSNYSSSKHQQENILPMSKKLHLTSHLNTSNETIRNKGIKISIPIKEDDIQTMIESFPSNLNVDTHQSFRSNKKSEIYKKSHNPIKIFESVKECKALSKCKLVNGNEKVLKNVKIEKNYCSNILSKQKDQLIQNKSNSSNLSTSSITDVLYTSHKKCQSKLNSSGFEKCISNQKKFGTKNVQSICCSDKDNKEENCQYIDLKEQEEFLAVYDVSCQANYLKSSGTFKLSISELLVLSLIEYKNQYQCILKSSPMYTSNTQNKPWEVVAWIADKLVDELIIGLSNDFQMDDIIQKLFELEFQEF